MALSKWEDIQKTPEYQGQPEEQKVASRQRYDAMSGVTALKPPQDDSNNFVRGLKGGVQSLQATGYGALGLAGKAVGSDKLRDVGFEGYQRNIEEGKPFQTDVQNFTDIKDVKSAGQWAAGTAGQLLPFIGESIAAAGIGAALGSAVAPGAGTVAGGLAGRTVLKRGINAYLKSATGKAVAKSQGAAAARAAGAKIAARNLGSAAGVVAGTAIPESGGMFGESAEKHGIENANWMSAAGLGLISGASELIAPGGKFARAAFGKGGKEFLDNYGKTAGKSLWKRLGIQVPKDMAGEFGQEAFQEFLGKVNEKVNDPAVSLKDKEALMGYFNSGMAGALGGGLFGTVGAVQQPGPVRKGAGPMERLVNGLPPEGSGKPPETDTPTQGVNTDVETSPLDLAPQNKEEQANELAWQAREAEEAGFTEDAAELQAQADALYGEVEQVTPQLGETTATVPATVIVQTNDKVDGLIVREDVPNLSSIAASVEGGESLPGVRIVDMEEFTLDEAGVPTDSRSKQLAAEIETSGEINPLIVAYDEKGPYIIEGSHRYDALKVLGKKSFPAVVVEDGVNITEQRKQGAKVESEAKTEDTLYSYAGKKAETANLPMQAQAAQRIEAGENAETVRKETGWFQAKDDKWRFEINDREMKVDQTPFTEQDGKQVMEGKLGDTLQHEKLTAAYPELKDINVKLVIDPTVKTLAGQYDRKNNELVVVAPNKEQLDSTVLHELQHGIQSVEGFARGGSPTSELKKYKQAAKSVELQVKRFNIALETLDEGTSDYELMSNAKEEFLAYHAQKGTLNTKKSLEGAFKDYTNLLGEIEARDVSARMKLTDEQRKILAPYASQGIAEKDMVVKGAGGVAAKATTLSDIKKKWKGNKLHISETKNEIRLNTVIVPRNKRKQGVGSGIMNDLTEYADSKGKILLVTPAVKDDFHGTTSQARLKKFYKRFGFVENKGRNKDFAINARDMYREPVEQDVIVAKAEKPATVAEKTAKKESALRKEVGNKTISALEKKGLVKVVSLEEATEYLERTTGKKMSELGEVEGFAKNGKIVLAEENIRKGQGKSVLLHEVGHIYLPKLFKGKQWNNLVKAFMRHDGKDTPVGRAITRAVARVPANTNPNNRAEEAIMYYLSETANQKQNLYRQIMAYIKSALIKMGVSAEILNPNDVRAMVQGYIDTVVKESYTKGKGETTSGGRKREKRERPEQRPLPDSILNPPVSPGVTYSVSVKRVDVNTDGTRSAVGIVSRGYGQGKPANVLFLKRDFKSFGTTKTDKKFVDQWADIIRAVPKEQRDNALKIGYGGKKLEGQPLVQLSSGCGRNAAILSAMESGLIDAGGMKDMVSCHGACYKNFDQGASSGGSIWAKFLERARLELKGAKTQVSRGKITPGIKRTGASKNMVAFFNQQLSTDLKPADLTKTGSKETKAYVAAKDKYDALSVSKKAKIFKALQKQYPEMFKGWVPQEAQAVVVATPAAVREGIKNMRKDLFMKFVNAPSDFIRGNQQGDWQQEIIAEEDGTTTWEAYIEAILSRWEKETGQNRSLFPKKISMVTAAWYVDVPMATYERIAQKYGDHLLLQVTGSFDFQAPEAKMRLLGIKKLHEAGLNPIVRMVTDEFNAGSKDLNDPKAIEMTVDFLINNKIKPEQVLETPVHFDHPRLGGFVTKAEQARIDRLVEKKGMDPTVASEKVLGSKISSMTQAIESLWETQPDEAERRARAYLERNTLEELKDESQTDAVAREVGHNLVGLTHERLMEIGIPKKKLDQLRDLGYTYAMPAKRGGKKYEGVFPNRCCTTGKCLTCGTQCSAKYTGLIEKDADAKAQAMLEKYGPTDAASMVSEAGYVKLDVPMFSVAQPAKMSLQKATDKITDSAAFKKWFGDSKVVDEDGEPLVVYHGTDEDFTKFEYGRKLGHIWGNGFYFTEDKEDAKRWGELAAQRSYGEAQVMPVYLNIRNPLELEGDGHENTIIEMLPNAFRKQMLQVLDKEFDSEMIDALKGEYVESFEAEKYGEEILSYAKDFGYDGVTGTYDNTLHYVAINKAQIKSIYNKGTFDETNPDIRFSVASTSDAFAENRAVQGNLKGKATTTTKRMLSGITSGVDKYMGAISTRLANINPKLRAEVKRLGFAIGTKGMADIKAVQPLMKKAKANMTKADFIDWDYARKNSVKEKIDELVTKYNLGKEYKKYRDRLDQIHKEAEGVGLDIGWIEEYAPRILKDSKGFLNHLGRGDDWGAMSEALKAKAAQQGMAVADMTDEMKADIVSNILLGGQYGMGGPPGVKKRTIKEIPPDLNQFYMDSDAALVSYLHSMRKTIEQRKFFGKVPDKIAEAKRQMHASMKALREEEKGKNRAGRVETLSDNIKMHRDVLNKYRYSQHDYKENIGQYTLDLLNKRGIQPEDENKLAEIFDALFHERGTRGVIQAYKNFSYIDTMGSPISALTQIGDLAWSAYNGGLIPTMKAAFNSAIKKSRITKEDVGVERIAQEFADSDTLSGAVNKVFKIVGLEKMDTIGKEALLNSALAKYEKQAQKNPEKLASEISVIFEGETQDVIADLQAGEITDNVKLLVYSRLLDFQPAGLSEMPEQYLRAGNGRLFYMLKSYTLKQFDVFRNEVYNGLKSGDKATQVKAMRNLVMLTMFLVMANAGADELKDLVLRRKTDFKDRVMDNVLRLFGISKFVTWKARTEGIGTAMAKQILPPYKFIDSATRDLVTAGDEKGMYIAKSIPVAGKLYYWHMGRGSHKREDLWDRRFSQRKKSLNKIKDRVEKNPKNATKYSKQLVQLNRVNKFQGRLNKNRRQINKLLAAQKTGRDVEENIKRVRARRVVMIQTFMKSL